MDEEITQGENINQGTEQVADFVADEEVKEKKNKVGRPLKFGTVEELQNKIDEYFDSCDNTIVKKILNKNQEIIAEISRPYTITGLAEWLETNRQTLINYEEKNEFFDTIKNAKAKIEACYEERALLGDNNPVVSIFTLKNNYGWKDKTETDLTTKGESLNNMSYERAKGIITGGKESDKSNSPE